MDFTNRAPHQGSPRRSPMETRLGGNAEADENEEPTRRVPAGNASPLRKKVLGEWNGAGGWGMEVATPPPQPKPTPVPTPPALTGLGAGAYDPKTNYTTPRPEFLRYDPERRREMLLRLAREAEFEEEEDCSSAASGTEPAGSHVTSGTGSGSDVEIDDADENEEEQEQEKVTYSGRGRWVRRLFLLLVAVACWYCMNPTPFPVHPDDGLAFTESIAGIYDAAGVHELSWLGTLHMMGPEDVLEETVSPIVQGGNEHVRQYDQRVSSRNQMAIATMGLADTCPIVQLGEFVCRVGDEFTDNLSDLKDISELSEQNAAKMVVSFENDAPNISCHSIGSTSIQTNDMQGGNSGSIHQEERVEYSSNQFVPQIVSAEKEIGPANDKLDSRMDLESERLDIHTELWQYEQTAEAAKEMCSKVKFLGSALKPHLLQILVFLSVAGLVAAAIVKFHPKSWVTVLQQNSAKSLAEVPMLVPHQIVQLPGPKQDQSGTMEVPMQWPLPKSGPPVSFKDPVQLALPKTGPSGSLKAPVVDHGNRVQKLQKEDAEATRASLGNSRYHRDDDSFKPPVVEQLGEFTFKDSSRGKSIRNLNQHAGHVSVQESSESFGEDVDKMHKNSSILQTPCVGRARKQENALKGEIEKDAMSTSLRRSSRLRSKLTSP